MFFKVPFYRVLFYLLNLIIMKTKDRIINQIAIFWWEWNFWKFMWNIITNTWIKVVNILENTKEKEKKLIIENSDVIIFCVPINKVIDTIKTNADIIIWDKLVLDVTWIKTPAMEELKKLNVTEIVWTHPMFWPFWDNLKWKKIVFSPEKVWKKWSFIKKILIKSWAKLTNLSPEEHDKKMAIIQALTHIINIIFIKTIKDVWFHPRELESLQTPLFQLQSLIWWRMLTQSSELYADMQMSNSVFLEEVLNILKGNLDSLIEIDISWDKKWFVELFEWLSDFLWDFKDKSMISTKQIEWVLNK